MRPSPRRSGSSRLKAGVVAAAGGPGLVACVRRIFSPTSNEIANRRTRAEIDAETAKQTTDFMVGLFEVSDPSEALGNTITAREIIDKGADRIKQELTTQPAIQATLMDTMGTVFKSLGLYTEAGNLLDCGVAETSDCLEMSTPTLH